MPRATRRGGWCEGRARGSRVHRRHRARDARGSLAHPRRLAARERCPLPHRARSGAPRRARLRDAGRREAVRASRAPAPRDGVARGGGGRPEQRRRARRASHANRGAEVITARAAFAKFARALVSIIPTRLLVIIVAALSPLWLLSQTAAASALALAAM